MPLTRIQKDVLSLLAENRSPESHLAGATGIHIGSKTTRYSHDLDIFHASEEAVASAYSKDSTRLTNAGYSLELMLSQPGFIRAVIRNETGRLLIDWAQDSIWRFFPPVQLEAIGYVLHPVDLAINKVLALAGRSEPRDFVDTLYLHECVLPLGALVWAATGKDPGLNPAMLLEMLQRRGQITEIELRRLDLRRPMDLKEMNKSWKSALKSADEWINERPADQAGCLYTHPQSGLVFAPLKNESADILEGKPGGVLPKLQGVPIRSFSESPELRQSLEEFFQTPLSG